MPRMCRTCSALGVAVLVGVVAVPQDRAAEPLRERLTLRQAIDEAFARSPLLQSRKTEVEQAEGRLLTAKVYPFNPEFVVIQREYIETVTDALLAGIELDLASGVTPTATANEAKP